MTDIFCLDKKHIMIMSVLVKIDDIVNPEKYLINFSIYCKERHIKKKNFFY